VRLREVLSVLVVCLLFSVAVVAQSPNGTINGLVLDPSGKVIAGAEITIVNDATGVQYAGRTNTDGIYVVTNLPPGPYRMQVANIGFKTLIKPDIVLNVQDALAINFTLPVGAVSETVTVEGGAPLVNTQSAAVSTVIDSNFIENLPLNGRSFNTLLQLTPGVVIAPVFTGTSGQFSISGQRTSANSFLIDGVSANFGGTPSNRTGTAGTGAAQAFSALGGTSSLVSVEDLQEFRVETSSFAPEFGRSPGGQVVLTTRSGTDSLHGGVYEYFRNDVLDANDWFASEARQSRAAERHNDFGGYLGGAIQSDKTFFFVSYEGARLRQPHPQVVVVPSEYARTTASSEIAPFLDGYPQPDDKTITPGVYTGTFTGNVSNPATLDAGSIRIDHNFNSKFSVFGRYNEAPSETAERTQSLSETDTTDILTRTVTIGSAMVFSPQISNSLRGNYSIQKSSLTSSLDSFGGASAPSLSFLAPGLANPSSAFLTFITFDTGSYSTGQSSKNASIQLNFADDLVVTHGAHELKFGADYRAIYLDLRPPQVGVEYAASSVSSFVSTGEALLVFGSHVKPAYFLSQSASLYAQDAWKVTPRLVLTYGLRWELDPAPSGRKGTTLAAWENVNDPAALALAPFGTPLWKTTYTDFAPRLGLVYKLTDAGDFVVRAGGGVFYDLASDAAGNLGTDFPNTAFDLAFGIPLPLANVTPYIPAFSLQPPFPNPSNGFAPNLKLPRSYQWNVALEKSFRGQQAVSLSYVGQAGRDLLRQEGINQPNANFSGAFDLTQNDARSNYNALQLQYRRPLSTRFQALLSYAWSHALDNASNDSIEAVSNTVISAANDYASSDFDVRQSFSGALLYAIPSASNHGALEQLTRDWSIDAVIVARTGFPFNAIVPTAEIAGANPRPDLVPGQRLFVLGAQCDAGFQVLGVLTQGQSCPGGRGVNPAAFTPAPAGQQGNEPRNDLPGYGLTQIDFSLGRKFAITDRLNLQFRADAFNLFNHPNFSNPSISVGSPSTFLSASMLNQGLGGLSSLFQEGGPRSLQLSLKFSF
jgi:hypothetical protein